MKILLIEDDPNKMERISNFLNGVNLHIKLQTARSYQSGLRAIVSEAFDLILLDMSLPVYDVRPGESGFDAPSFAGEDILAEISRKMIR